MPAEIKDIKQFLEYARRADVKAATIKKNVGGATKFKIRGSRHLYTLSIKDKEKARKLIHSLPPNLTTSTISKKANKKQRYSA